MNHTDSNTSFRKKKMYVEEHITDMEVVNRVILGVGVPVGKRAVIVTVKVEELREERK